MTLSYFLFRDNDGCLIKGVHVVSDFIESGVHDLYPLIRKMAFQKQCVQKEGGAKPGVVKVSRWARSRHKEGLSAVNWLGTCYQRVSIHTCCPFLPQAPPMWNRELIRGTPAGGAP